MDNIMLDWAKSSIVKYKGFATKRKVVCMQCGESFSTELVHRKNATCPHCSTKINVEKSRCTTDKQTYYTAFAEVVAEYQVIRYFVHYCYFKAGKQANINSWEVLQLWIKENGKYEIIGKNHLLTSYCEAWTGAMEIRQEYPKLYAYYGGNKYDIYAERFHPKSEIKDIYKKYGIDNKLQGLTFLQAIRLVPTNPRLETLLKRKMYDVLDYFGRKRLDDRYW